MCGIFGLVGFDGRPVDPSVLRLMGDVTRHRGTDDFGDYAGTGSLLGMCRVSIIELAGGHQPIGNEDRSVWAVCNGEIYGFKALRSELLERGHRFSTGSDSEVLVHLYEEYGDQF